MQVSKTKKSSGFKKLMAGATAGATIGLVTYMFLKNDKATSTKVEADVITNEIKENLFV